MKEVFIDDENLKLGLYALEDTTKAPFGSAREMKNCTITDRGGVAPRMGTSLLGTFDSGATGVKGLYNFKTSFSTNEVLIKSYDDELEAYSKDNSAADWFRVKNGFTAGKEFGFVTSLVNNDNEDYVIFCNRFEEYQRWIGSVTQLDGALSGSETEVQVDSVLTEEIFHSATASSATSTTIDVAGTPWAASQWVNMYVYITSGTHIGKIRLISANTSSKITFATLGSTPGTATFEIRKTAFPATGTIIYAGTTIAYTGFALYNQFSVSSAHAASDDTAVTIAPVVYPENPRGNRLTNYLGRIIVGNVRSAIARDSGGALQGYASGGSYFVSNINDPIDFTFAATRVAGEGDIIGTPFGGGEITDVAHQEDTAYVFKKRYIESVKYSQDANDFSIRSPLKAGVGSSGQIIKGADDIYFVTEDNKFTSLGRVKAKDILPQTENIGINIKRLLDNYLFGVGRGIEYKDKVYLPTKSSSTETNNNIVVVYNKTNKSFEGIWDIYAFAFEVFNDLAYYGESNTPNVYQMLVGHSDVVGTDRYPIVASYASHFMNLTPSKVNQQALNSMYFEGYIKGNTTITFQAWKDFASDPFLKFDFSGTETGLLDGLELTASLGTKSIGLRPLGSLGEVDEEGRRHFQFRVYFPFQYANFFSVGFESAGSDFDYELTRFGLGVKETISVNTTKIKTI